MLYGFILLSLLLQNLSQHIEALRVDVAVRKSAGGQLGYFLILLQGFLQIAQHIESKGKGLIIKSMVIGVRSTLKNPIAKSLFRNDR